MTIRAGEMLIFGLTPDDHVKDVEIDGEVKGRGLIPRPWDKFPAGCYASAPHTKIDMSVIDQAEWPDRLKDMISNKSLLSDIRLTGNGGQPIPSLDQDGVGYCWAHSSTSANTILRAVMNEPYVPLSAFCVAATIKHGADEGGWGAQSMDFLQEKGQCSQAVWPQGDRNYKKYDKPETWSDAAKHKITEGWIDMESAQYDRALTFAQVATCCLCRIPVVVDFNWWSHSVCALDLVQTSGLTLRHPVSGKRLGLKAMIAAWEMTGGFGLRIWNSWNDSWSDRGMGVLTGNKAIPDGSVAPRVAMAA